MPSEDSTASSELEELRRELAEAREQRSTTAEILRVISSSPTDLKRVFAEVASSATRLCDASDATIHQAEGDVLRIVAHHGPIPPADTLPLTRVSATGRAVLERKTDLLEVVWVLLGGFSPANLGFLEAAPVDPEVASGPPGG